MGDIRATGQVRCRGTLTDSCQPMPVPNKMTLKDAIIDEE